MPALLTDSPAFGHPGIPPRWTSARKEAIGTAYSSASRVWFTIWEGIITETYYPTVDRPQTRDWQLLFADGKSLFHEEKRDFKTEVTPLTRESLGFRIVQEQEEAGYLFEKRVIADPHYPCVLQHVRLQMPDELRSRLKVYSLCSPHLGVGGADNNAYVCRVNGRKILVANKKNTWLAVAASVPFSKASCGFVGASDGWTDLNDNCNMDWEFNCALGGNVALTGELDLNGQDEFVMAMAFGHGAHNAITVLLQSLAYPFDAQESRFLQQWERANKKDDRLYSFAGDGGRLYESSYKTLIAHEDKLNPGAYIASLSIPWGDTKGDEDLGGYHLVWPRDMVNTATGLLAAGNHDMPLRALMFLAAAQKADGGFYQNFWISGEPYWTGVQLDEVSFPIMLAWRLKRHNALQGFDPFAMVMSAVAYLLLNGPITQQERWEEVAGFSPSTLAANIAALTCAASFCQAAGDGVTAEFIQDYADYLKCHLEDWTVTTCGDLLPGHPEYFIRINPVLDPSSLTHPNDAQVVIANRAEYKQHVFPARNIVDGGFLELVRYGVYPADARLITETIKVVDAALKVDTPNGPCWHRYNHDGYGQQEDGSAFDGVGVGRAWPLLTGERAHYELAAGNDVKPYIKALEAFVSRGGTLPEQVWDTTDIPAAHLYRGGTTGAARPLAWAHAEYIKLLRSMVDGKIFDTVAEVEQRYVHSPQLCKLIEIWHHKWQTPRVHPNFFLRILAGEKFDLVLSDDGWQTTETCRSTATKLGVHYCDIPAGSRKAGDLQFTFHWLDRAAWEGKNYTVTIGT